MLVDPAKPLTENLSALGYTHRPAEPRADRPSAYHHNRRDVLDASGAVVFTGNAGEVWHWLGVSLEAA